MFFKSMTEEEKAEQTIGVLQGLYNAYKLHIVDDEFMFAVKEIGKAVPKEPIRKKWMPNLCPTCGVDLGGECNDGYYENPRYDHCPNCRQMIRHDD